MKYIIGIVNHLHCVDNTLIIVRLCICQLLVDNVDKATLARVSFSAEPSKIVALKISGHKFTGSIKGRSFLDQ